MREKVEGTAIHATAAAAAWGLTHYLCGRLLRGRAGVRHDAEEALIKAGAHAASVVVASFVVRRVL